MTVGELREALRDVNEDVEVVVRVAIKETALADGNIAQTGCFDADVVYDLHPTGIDAFVIDATMDGGCVVS